MRIATMEIHPITMTLRTPIPMSNRVIEKTDNVLIRLVTDYGVVGWGEGVEAPALTHQTQADIMADLEALVSTVVGSDPMRRTELWGRLQLSRPSATTAIGAIDIALHDVAGKALGVPVHQLLGGGGSGPDPGSDPGRQW